MNIYEGELISLASAGQKQNLRLTQRTSSVVEQS
jgi:hypothetical protein